MKPLSFIIIPPLPRICQKVDRIIRRWINLINETLSKWTRVSEIDGTNPSASSSLPRAFAFEDITNQIINTELLLTQSGESTQQQRSGE